MRERLEALIQSLIGQGFEDAESMIEVERGVRSLCGSVVPARLFLAWLDERGKLK